ncbi:hypothetical protein CF319_g8294 [Tilletia indica]|nr:hypothetical protein CF319_g8294 [Tilletia indica]
MSAIEPLQEVTANSTFSSLDEFKHAVRFYALKLNFNPTWERSKSGLCVAVCDQKDACGCPFRVRAHVDADDSGLFHVSTFKEGHCCAGKPPSKRKAYSDHDFLKRLIKGCMSVDGKTTDGQIAAQLKQSYGIAPPQPTINKARNAIIGSALEDQQREFQYIQAWLARVQEKHSDTIVEHTVEDGRFSRAFISPGAARLAWKQCKPFIAVDGTFTKNKFGMVLLLATGMDADSNLIIIAWALVRSESQDTWDWFLRLLLVACPTLSLSSTTIISDRQKGLLNAIENVLPETTEGFCCWRLAENVKKHYGAEARRLFWPLVYAATEAKFKDCMETLRQHKSGAADYLADTAVPHKHWASYAFPGRRFDHVTSNLSEIANSALRRHRELPPLQIMASIYDYEMMHFHKRASAAARWQQGLAPHPYELFLKAVELARRMNVSSASGLTGLVTSSSGKTYEVKLPHTPAGPETISCSCGYPDLMLLPCAHVCCFAASQRLDVVPYAASYYKATQWKDTYAVPYVPVSREDLDASSIEAPAVAKKRGRPQVKRREAGQGSSKARTSGQQLEEAASSSSTSFAPIEIAFCRACGDTTHTTKQCSSSH